MKAAAKETRKEQSRAARKVHKDGKKGKTRDPVVAEYGTLCGCCAACAHQFGVALGCCHSDLYGLGFKW